MRRAVRATSPDGAIRTVVRGLHEQFDAPVAGWWGNSGGPLVLMIACGLTSSELRAVRQKLGSMTRGRTRPARNHASPGRDFAEITGAGTVDVIDAGDGLLFVADFPDEWRPVLRRMGPFLADVLRHLTAAALAEHRNESLDLGLTRVLHELRGPVVSAATVMEHLIAKEWCIGSDLELVAATKEQLQDLACLMETTLPWAVGEDVLQRTQTDLVRVVRDAVQSRVREHPPVSVEISTPRALPFHGDPERLRVAFGSFTQAALDTSGGGTMVVELEDEDDLAVVRIIQARNGGRHPKPAVFVDPLAGDQSARSMRAGPLALFAARSVIEAHGGAVWDESGDDELALRVELPLPSGGIP